MKRASPALRTLFAVGLVAVASCALSCSRGDQLLGWQTEVELPWYGGSAHWRKWDNGPPADPQFFIRAVWMQNPSNVQRYQSVGVNFYTGLWEGPTETQLDALAAANMPAISDQAGVWASHLTDRTLRGWLQPDQPDGAQDLGNGTYGPCMPPADVVALYADKVKKDETRPVYLELGLGSAEPDWEGRGSCVGHPEQYDEYVKGGDILGSVIYPIHSERPLETVALGIDRLRAASHDRKPVIAVLETSAVDGVHRPTPAQVKSQIWMSIVHGAAGIEYYCHRIEPSVIETDCIDDAPMAAELARNNQQIDALAPVLDTPPLSSSTIQISSAPSVRIDTLLKRYRDQAYLFVVEMEANATQATFRLPGNTPSSIEVLGEGRTIAVAAGAFTDSFERYGVHIYRWSE